MSLPLAPTAPATTPRGALSPALAAKLDELSDQGRRDRVLSQLGINPLSEAEPVVDDRQLALFTQSEDGDTFVSYEGETL